VTIPTGTSPYAAPDLLPVATGPGEMASGVLTTIYVVVVGVRNFEPAYRVLSFLVLGAVLLVVSLSFTRARQRKSSS